MFQQARLSMPTVIAALMLTGCGGEKPQPAAPAAPSAAEASSSTDTLVARLSPASDSEVSGVVVLTRSDGKLILGAAIDNIAAGEHAIHVHENGDCSAADATSAGGHFAPDGQPHGGADAPAGERHAGDFGNFMASEFDQGKFSITKVADYPLDVFEGRAVIVHARPDDLASQPAGDAGARVACGVLAPISR